MSSLQAFVLLLVALVPLRAGAALLGSFSNPVALDSFNGASSTVRVRLGFCEAATCFPRPNHQLFADLVVSTADAGSTFVATGASDPAFADVAQFLTNGVRLNIFPIDVPTLRKRTEDIPLLVHYFVNKYASRIGKRITEVDPETMARLVAYPWPGNVRELENVIERAVILSSGPRLEVDPDAVRAAPGSGAELRGPALTLADGERRQILAALDQTDWVIEGPRGAAKMLGLNPNTLRSRMKKLEIARRPR